MSYDTSCTPKMISLESEINKNEPLQNPCVGHVYSDDNYFSHVN